MVGDVVVAAAVRRAALRPPAGGPPPPPRLLGSVWSCVPSWRARGPSRPHGRRCEGRLALLSWLVAAAAVWCWWSSFFALLVSSS